MDPFRENHVVGDPDPTPKHVVKFCLVDCLPDGGCTWEEGHGGEHVAGDGDVIVGTMADDAVVTCRQFYLCMNVAVGTLPHPILGDVPSCQRCADKLEAIR